MDKPRLNIITFIRALKNAHNIFFNVGLNLRNMFDAGNTKHHLFHYHTASVIDNDGK